MTGQSPAPKAKRPFFRGCLTVLECLLLLAVVVYAVLDYVNFPFLPVDYLRPMGAVDVSCLPAPEFAEDFLELIRAEGGVALRVTKLNGAPVTGNFRIPSRTDADGLVKLYLPRGKYSLRADVHGVRGGKMIRFANAPSGAQVFAISQRTSSMPVQMRKVSRLNPEEEQEWLEELAAAGRYDEALAFALSLRGSEDSALTGRLVLLRRLSAMQSRIRELPLAAYNSQIDAYTDVLEVVQQLAAGRELPNYRTVAGTRTMPVVDHLQAIAEARDAVIAAHLDNYQQLLDAGHLILALEQWLHVEANPELYRPGMAMAETVAQTFQALYSEAQDMKEQVGKILKETLDEAKALSAGGRISEARALLSDLHRQARFFSQPLELEEEFAKECENYLEDVEVLAQAEIEYQHNRFTEALTLYQSVKHQSAWLDKRIKETEELL